jgi:hypothetical protein
MTCPECERYRVLLAVTQDARTRAALIADQAAHWRAEHPDGDARTRASAGLASGLWPGKKVRVQE